MSQRPRAASQPGRPPSIQSPRLLKGLRRRALSTQPTQGLEEELTCTVCCEIFHEPVVLNCTHSFCQSCLQQFWRKNPAGRQCPVCRRRCSSTEPPISLTLKNVAETFLRQKESEPESGQIPGSSPKVQCPAHEEVLKLFCQDDEETLCFVCHMSRKHTGHQVCPLEEAVLSRKVRGSEPSLIMERTERQMKEEFDQLHQFLQKEEADRIAALRDEHERKSQLVKRKTECLMRDILSISNTIIGIDNEISASDALFLQVHHTMKLEIVMLGRQSHLLTPVTLDPNTAYAWLSLSSDLTSVTNAGNMQEVPDNPERFNHLVFVLGSEGFLSGQHAWEVEVGNKDDWVLGVVKESINRKGKVSGRPEDGFWTIALCEGQFTAMTTPRTTLQVEGPLEKVRVQLDCDAGLVVFSNPVNMTTIYTFKDHFIEKMFPFFCPGANINGNNSRPLKICPVRVAIWNSATW
uniref:Tripartite motif containing 35-12 n=1 Tax=Scleropages formosus TaxID=113540 RepID=A0A8C9V962_SCLFO